MSRTRLAIVLLVPVLGLAACTSGRGVATESAGAPTDSVSDAVTTPDATSATPSTTAPTSSAAAVSTTPAASTSAAAPAVPAFTTTCATLSVRVLKGGADRGTEVAAMQFVNDGAAPCTITGTPTARLLRGGAAVGRPSRPNGVSAKPYTVPPGDYGESLLRDFSTCEAPLSDSLRLSLPTRNGKAGRTATEPVQLRACRIEVAPVGAPS